MVLAAFGARPFSGVRVAIDTVFRMDVALYVVVRSESPPGACVGPLNVVQPVDVVRLPRGERPISFIERSSSSQCPGK